MSKKLSKAQFDDFKRKVDNALEPYKEIDDELKVRVRDYLLEGGDASCLLSLGAAYQKQDRKKFFQTKHGRSNASNQKGAKKVFELFQFRTTPEGYYRRLGVIASHIPETSAGWYPMDPNLPEWFQNLFSLRFLLSGGVSYYYGTGLRNNDLKIKSFVDDFETKPEKAALIRSMVSQVHNYQHLSRYLWQAADWKEIFSEHIGELEKALNDASAAEKETVLGELLKIQLDFSPMLNLIAEFAVGTSKKVRPLAQSILQSSPDQAVELLNERLQNGNASARANAAEALVAIQGEKAQQALQARLKSEKGKRVRQTIENLLQSFELQADVEDDDSATFDEIELPVIEFPSNPIPLPDGFVDQLWEQFEQQFDKLEKQYVKQSEAYKQPDRPQWMSKPQKPTRLKRKELDTFITYFEGKNNSKLKCSQWAKNAFFNLPVFSKWTDASQLHILHVVRMLALFNSVHQYHSDTIHLRREDLLEDHRDGQKEPYGLRELNAALETVMSIESGTLAKTYLQMNSWGDFLDWEADAVWPLFVEESKLFRHALLGVTSERYDHYANGRCQVAMRVAAMMPFLPRDIEAALWGVALGEAKKDRPAARRALHTAANHLQRAITALQDGKQGIRIAGAEMLAELGDASAVDPLKKALKKEKQELVKGAILQAIEQLGGDVDEFLGRRKQLIDAKKGLDKKRPKGMEWVRLESLPKVRWGENNKTVSPEIVQWWVVQSIQFKFPTCGPILKRSLEMCRDDDAALLARFILSEWIAYDTKAPSRDECMKEATKQAASQWKQSSWYKEYYKTEENFRNMLVQQMMGTYLQSAIGQKGMLAIVAGAGDRDCVQLIEKYIRKHHGHRLAQSKALLEVLAWINDPLAIQLLLSLGNRFRTKGIRVRAAEIVQEIAEREGWTMDELADRTIPDAGFARETDEDGQPIGDRAELVLDYGSRTFSVILGDQLEAVITRDDGKTVKSLPAAAKNDDPDLVKVAKKEFSAAKKTIKEVVKGQADRLYEATCTQRVWSAVEWKRYLVDHPVMGALCRRVVWVAYDEDDSTVKFLFRPLEDGSLTDVNDEEVTLNNKDLVRVAHSSLLDDATEEAWKEHLKDYDVPELFQQFGRESYRLPKSLKKETEITDFRGHMLTTFRLRSRATKLGWARGDIEDAGSFGLYQKPFRSQQINAIIEFTGSYVPEEDIPAGLRELYFVPMKPNDDSTYSWNPRKVRLEDVPVVLLSECYNDMKEIAAEGTGFDPEWEKKGLW